MKGPRPIGGFPEWLPDQRLVEQTLLDRLRATFELHGFLPIETRAVERLESLLKQGETDKEIYVLRRLQAAPDEDDTDLGLHYDLTVPFARYVLERRGELVFPLRRYQIQKSWRGERPQEGRFREFCQADVDVVGLGSLALHFDAEVPLVMLEALAPLPLPSIRLLVNNRKILEGLYRAVGIQDVPRALRAVDKLDKLGERGVHEQLTGPLGLAEAQARACLELARIHTEDASFADKVQQLGYRSDLLDQGLEELTVVMEALGDLPRGSVAAALHVARGFDYYTGTVYESVLEGHEALGAVCSGGRYDDLASAGGSVRHPGVGISLGVSRLLARLFGRGALRATRTSPACVLVALPSEAARPRCARVAAALRRRGIASYVAAEPVKYGRQIRYAERLGIPFVWFPEGEQSGGDEVRDIRSGEQVAADPERWSPPAEDLRPRVTLDQAGA
ncbi:MAG TPA: histidine--tRNA ligase [Actinomycetes bacterium]|nr:histidine--tRNA ligase [Actinomycetes bacterium]